MSAVGGHRLPGAALSPRAAGRIAGGGSQFSASFNSSLLLRLIARRAQQFAGRPVIVVIAAISSGCKVQIIRAALTTRSRLA